MYREVVADIDTLKAVDFTKDIAASVWMSLSKIIRACLVPEQDYGEDRPPEEADFEQFRKDILHGFRIVENFIRGLISTSRPLIFDRESLAWTLILCGEHVSTYLWTSEETFNLSNSCVKALCSFYNCASVSQLLLGQTPKRHSPCFKQALLLLRPNLLQSTWRKHPGAVASYRWLLFQIRSPHLSEYLDIVSPTALIILDDHDEERRLMGLHCMSHIIDNVARTELCQRGLHQVFYKTLEPMLLQRAAKQVEPTLMCITKLLNLIERGYTRSTEPGMWDLFDSTLETLIDKMVLEDQIPLRVAYIKSLAPLISAMGPSVIRWYKPLINVFDEYLHNMSFETRKYALEALQIFISLLYSRMDANGDFCLYLLLRTLHDISSAQEQRASEVDIIKDCILLIREAAPLQFQPVAQELETLTCNTVMKNVFTECCE